jgi:hypothetical protein
MNLWLSSFPIMQGLHGVARSCCKPNGGCKGIWALLSQASVPEAGAEQICGGQDVLCDASGNIREIVIDSQPFTCTGSALQPLANLTKLEQLSLVRSNITGVPHSQGLFV